MKKSNILVIIVCVICISFGRSSSATLSARKNILKSSRASILPPLDDPKQLDDVQYFPSSEFLSGEFTFSNGVMDGLPTIRDDFRGRHYGMVSKLNSILDFDYLSIRGYYTVDGRFMSVIGGDSAPLKGQGSYAVNLTNPKIITSARITLNPINGNLIVGDVLCDFLFDEIQMTAENAEYDGELIDWKETNIGDIVKINYDLLFIAYFEGLAMKGVERFLIDFIKGKTMSEINDIFNGKVKP